MGFWWFMLCCDLLVPLIMIVFGRVLWKHPPGGINMVYGYRTKRSMQNEDTWKFAQGYCGRIWWKTGWIMLILSALVHLPFRSGSQDAVGWFGAVLGTVQCIVLIVSVFPTERALKKNFGSRGERLDPENGA